jgi:DNA adenine methylase
MVPFLKWPGGKRWFVRAYAHLLPKQFDCYFEPFLGAGSVYFHLKPEKSVLTDINPDVINAYKGIRQAAPTLVELLKEHQSKHSEDYYYQMRAIQPECEIHKAARMIYLNRTCFNGIYRVNRQGVFNVPKGTRQSVILADDQFDEVSKLLSTAIIQQTDFESTIDQAKRGDLVFADPPYTVRHNMNGFVKYNEKLFSWQDQERLAAALVRAKSRGAHIVMTNANHSSIRDLYQDSGFSMLEVSRYSSISAGSGSRKHYDEIVIHTGELQGD